MKAMGAIRQFMGTQGTNPNMTYTTPGAREMKAFLDICTPCGKASICSGCL
jgi:hypothetical protein